MRGRLWALWGLQTGEGAFCIFMGLAKGSLGATIVLMVRSSFPLLDVHALHVSVSEFLRPVLQDQKFQSSDQRVA